MINQAEKRMKMRQSNRRGAGRAKRGRFINQLRTRESNGSPADFSGLHVEGELDSLRQRARIVSQRLEIIRQRIEGQRIVGPQRAKVVAIVDEEECTGCGFCYEICPAGAISIDRTAEIDASKCTACLACVEQCPQGAIAVKYPDK